MNLRLFLKIIVLSLSGILAVQSNMTAQVSCKLLLQQACRNLNNNGKLPENDKIWTLEYSVQTIMRDSSKYKNANARIHIKVSADKLWYDNGEAELFQDRTTSVVMIHDRKILYLRDSDFYNSESSEKLMQQMLNHGDSLIAHSSVEKCESIVQNGIPVKKIVLLVSKVLQQKTTIQRMVYVIDEESGTIRSTRVEYIPESKIEAMETVFNSIEYNVDGEPFDSDVYPLFFNDDNELKDLYKQYRLVDVRAKENKH